MAREQGASSFGLPHHVGGRLQHVERAGLEIEHPLRHDTNVGADGNGGEGLAPLTRIVGAPGALTRWEGDVADVQFVLAL